MDNLVANLPPYSPVTADSLIQNHTLCPSVTQQLINLAQDIARLLENTYPSRIR